MMDQMTSASSPEQRTDAAPRPKTYRSWILHTLFGWTGRLYTAVGRSTVGRALTAYRRLDGAVGGGRQKRFRPVSRGCMPVAEAVRQSRILALVRGFWELLYDLPVKFYGLFALLYGAVGAILYCLIPLIAPWFSVDPSYLVVSLVMMLLSLPLVASHSTLRQSASRSGFAFLIFSRWLCVPLNAPVASEQRHTVGTSAVAVVLAFVTAIAALFVNAFLVPLLIFGIVLLWLVFSAPETGVLLSSFLWPFALVWPDALRVLVWLILLTWLGYALKLIRLHRVIRFDVSDIAALVLLVLCAISCVGGVIAGTGQVMPSILLFVCLSVYFLIVHLMTTRAYLTRCLVGVGMGVVVMMAVVFLSRTRIHAVDWVTGSRGGELVNDTFDYLYALAVGVDGRVRNLLLVMGIPFLCAALVRTRRLFSRVVVAALLGSALYLAFLSGSLGVLICLVCGLVLFCILLDRRSLAVGALLLPGTVGAVGWYCASHGTLLASVVRRISNAYQARYTRYAELWQAVAEKPFGHGAGTDYVGGNLPLEALVSLGWPGFAAMLIVLSLLFWKTLTALAHTTTFADRALAVGLFCGMVCGLLWGMTQGFLLAFPAILVPVMFCALSSSFANILFDESDARAAETMNAPQGVDRVYNRI